MRDAMLAASIDDGTDWVSESAISRLLSAGSARNRTGVVLMLYEGGRCY
jgi:hypothetical protein